MANLTFDVRHLRKIRNSLEDTQKRKVDRALDWTVKRLTQRTATYISRDIRSAYAIRAVDIKASLSIKRYNRDATNALLYTGGGLHLDLFKPKVRNLAVQATSKKGKRFKTHRRGVSLRIRKDRGRKVARGAWQSQKSGYVLRRRDMSDNESMPVQQRGPSIPGMVAHPETIEGAQQLVRNEFGPYFSDRLDYLLNKEMSDSSVDPLKRTLSRTGF